MSQTALAAIFARNNFYKSSFHNLLKVYFLLCCVTVILLYFIVEYRRDHTKPFYFATDALGQVLQLPSLNQAYLEDEEVTEWVKYVVEHLYSYNFVNYRKDLHEIRPYFTSKGYNELMLGLKRSNNLNAVRANRLVVYPDNFKQPIIVKKGIKGNKYSWIVQADLNVVYENELKKIVQPIRVDLLVQRESRLNNTDAIAIAQLVAQDR